MSEYLDEVTVPGVTTPSSAEVHEIPDSATIPGVTSLTFTELYAGVDASTVLTVTSLSAVEPSAFVDSAITPSYTAVSFVEDWSIRLRTKDYFDQPISTDIVFSTSYYVAGSVGPNDTDNGVLA